MAALQAMLEQATRGRGGVVGVAGPPGIGKSRVAHETAARTVDLEAEVVWTFCESHAKDVPFRAITSLLRASIGVTDLDTAAARARIRERIPTPTPRIWCSSMSCSALPILMCQFPASTPTPGGGD